MTPAFTDEQKEDIRKRLIYEGIELAGSVGFKKMTVASVARAAGVAVGTFYKFFDSKESFVVAMLKDTEDRAYAKLSERYTDGTIELEAFLELFRENFRPENNFMLRMRLDDWVWCKDHITDGSYFTNEADTKKVLELLPHIRGIGKDADTEAAANFIKTIYAMYQNRETFFEDALQRNVDMIFGCIFHCLKGE